MSLTNQSRRIVQVDNPHLPIACPNEKTPADLLHPRVWLEPAHQELAMCPYCGTVYRFRWGETAG